MIFEKKLYKVLMALTIGAIVTMLAAGCSNKITTVNKGAPNTGLSKYLAKSGERPNDKMLQPGDTANLNGLEITLNKVHIAKNEGKKGNKKLIADFNIGNAGEQAVLISAPVQFLLYDSGREVGKILDFDTQQRETEILPGEVLEKEIAWEVPAKSQPQSIAFNGDFVINKVGEDELVSGPITVLTQLKGEKRILFYIGDTIQL